MNMEYLKNVLIKYIETQVPWLPLLMILEHCSGANQGVIWRLAVNAEQTVKLCPFQSS